MVMLDIMVNMLLKLQAEVAALVEVCKILHHTLVSHNGPENGGDGIRILEFDAILPNDPSSPGGHGFFGGGGGAGGWTSSTSYDGRGGYGGGGNGGGYPTGPQKGSPNVGQNGTDQLGGGGGGGNQASGGRGGNGCIIVRYVTPSSEGGNGTRELDYCSRTKHW